MAEVTKKRAIRRCPPPPSQYPWLVFFHGKNMRNQTFYSISEPNKTCVRSVPELWNKAVHLSSRGWILLSHQDQNANDFNLWNPVTLESISLPLLELQPNQYIKDILLTSSPSNPDCTLLLFLRNPHSIVFCCIKDKTWITRGCSEDVKVIGGMEGYGDFFCCPVLCRGRIYAVTFSKGFLVEIEIVNWRRLVIRPIKCRRHIPQTLWCSYNIHWVESCGDLFMICVERGGVDGAEVISIDVLKLDLSNMVWSKVESCPDRAFFLSNGRAISCPVVDPDTNQIGGKVYFTLYDEDERLFSYSIADKSILMSLPCPSIPTPWRTPTWILPDVTCTVLTAGADNCSRKREEQGGKEEDGDCEMEKDHEQTMGQNLINLLDDLPLDVVEKITEQLAAFDYMSFRAVNKGCRSVTPAKQWRTASRSFDMDSYILSPWLIFPKKKCLNCLVDPRIGSKYKCYLTTPPSLEHAVVTCSKNGWLLMTNHPSLTLYNPLTKSILRLPDLRPIDQIFYISSLPNSADCVVIGFEFACREIYLAGPGRKEWTVLDLIQEGNKVFHPTHTCPVFLDGSFYFLGDKGCLGVIRLNQQEEYCSLKVHKMKLPCNSFEQNFLTECDGDLLSVFVGKAGKFVRVFKFNQSAMIWEEVKSLGKSSLYLSGISTFATKARIPGMENKIYFPRFDGESIVFYSLETGNFHSSAREKPLTNLYGTKYQTSSYWLEPRFNGKNQGIHHACWTWKN